jgi:Acetyltransferase (GNAT) family.
MNIEEQPEFDHSHRRDVYQYVERRGRVESETVRKALGFQRKSFGHHLAVLRRDGYLRKTGGQLEVAFQTADEEVHESGESSFTIRPAREADLGGLVGVIRSVAAGSSYIAAETVAELIDHEEALLRRNDANSRIFFVATVTDEVVGWVHLDLPAVESLAHTAQLTVGVLEEHRDSGIGGALLERGRKWAVTRDYEKLTHGIPASNDRGKRFLEAHGWIVEAVREDHYRIDGTTVDETLMKREL